MTSLVISSVGRSSLKLLGSQSPNSLANSITSRLSPIGAIYRCNYLNTCANPTHSNKYSLELLRKRSYINKLSHRLIYSAEALDIESLEHIKRAKSTLYGDARQRYSERIAEYLEKGETNLVVREDLINLIAFAENVGDIDLIDKLAELKKHDESFVAGWGAAVARLYYKFNQVDRAYNNLRDVDRFGPFFHQLKSFQVVMTMLFDADRHEHVLELYDLATKTFKMRENFPFKTHRLLSIITFASLAKMNTPESLEMAEKMFSEDRSNMKFMGRVVSFLSYLAVNQNKPGLALNLSSDTVRSYTSTRELKTISLLKLNRHEDVIYHLRNVISRTPHNFKIILKETYDYIENSQDKIEDEKVRQELMDLLVEIKQNDLVNDVTLESLIFTKIAGREQTPDGEQIPGRERYSSRERYPGRDQYPGREQKPEFNQRRR